ncbi:hypothetical protein ANN_17893 [Periplaneta americana]|uniref:Uncharacterized protein n=1 Tax=Periplaneta americana TaxID=6978 RepID=A0ABQ8SM92_PERAM|nr:hypothetical protein ANN_17893 [Periplaneta americana]
MALVILPCDLPWWPTVQRHLTQLSLARNSKDLIEGMQKIHNMCNSVPEVDYEIDPAVQSNSICSKRETPWQATCGWHPGEHYKINNCFTAKSNAISSSVFASPSHLGQKCATDVASGYEVPSLQAPSGAGTSNFLYTSPEVINTQPDFLNKFMMSDEAHFHLSGYVYKQNLVLLFTDSANELQQMLLELNELSNAVGLSMNHSKTKIMKIEVIGTEMHLAISFSHKMDKELKRRIAQA